MLVSLILLLKSLLMLGTNLDIFCFNPTHNFHTFPNLPHSISPFVKLSFHIWIIIVSGFLLTTGFTYSSSRSQMFFKTGIFKNFVIFTRKHLCWNPFLIKLRLQHRCFPGNIAKFLRTPFL